MEAHMTHSTQSELDRNITTIIYPAVNSRPKRNTRANPFLECSNLTRDKEWNDSVRSAPDIRTTLPVQITETEYCNTKNHTLLETDRVH